MDKFAIPCPFSKKELASIERRRKSEEERKARIFNPKVRTLGVDKNALDQQIMERKIREDREKERNKQYDEERIRHAQIAAQIDNQIDNMRRKINQEVDDYRNNYQKPEFRREFDLYDPSCLKKQLPCRISDDDPRCGPSSAQKFDGEDLRGKERLMTQREQQEAWLKQQLAEKQSAEDERKRAEKALQEAVIAQDQHATSMQHIQNLYRHKVQQATLEFNKALAAEKEANRKAKEAIEEEDKKMEVYNLMTSDLLTENPEVATSALGPHRLIPDRWKGMSDGQIRQIREQQIKQIHLKQLEKEIEKKKEEDWEGYILKCDQLAMQSQQELSEKRRQLNEHMLEYNRLLAQQQQIHREQMEVTFSNQATKEYFDQFNTTTR